MPIKHCSTCRKDVEIEDGNKTCANCRKISAKNRERKRLNKVYCRQIKPNKTRCNYEVHKECGNLYCLKHVNFWKRYKESNKSNKSNKLDKLTNSTDIGKYCTSRTQCDPDKPGIKAKLPDNYPKKKCESCLIRERAKDKELREKKKGTNEVLNAKNLFACTECTIGVKHTEKEMGIRADGKLSHLCIKHLDKKKEIESKRPERDRKEEFKKYESSLNRKFKKYQIHAQEKNIKFKLNIDQFEESINKNCHYCGITKGDYTNGINRIDRKKCYTIDNIVTACSLCNHMKNTLNEETFILMCTHIAHYGGLVNTRLFYEVFNNYPTGGTFNTYIAGAPGRKLEFKLSKKQFEKIINKPCYICGRNSISDKTGINTHRNGIDRYKNDVGYVLDNCYSCCGDCNYLKNEFGYENIITQCAYIALENENRLDQLLKSWKPSRFTSDRINKSNSTQIKNSNSKTNKKKITKKPIKKSSKNK